MPAGMEARGIGSVRGIVSPRAVLPIFLRGVGPALSSVCIGSLSRFVVVLYS